MQEIISQPQNEQPQIIPQPVNPEQAAAAEQSTSQKMMVGPEEALSKLKSMLDKGLITDADFDTKKAEVLARM